jgi:hypothetical protein
MFCPLLSPERTEKLCTVITCVCISPIMSCKYFRHLYHEFVPSIEVSGWVVSCCFLIYLFEFKFDRLNMNLVELKFDCFLSFEVKKDSTKIKFYTPSTYKYCFRSKKF